MDLGDDLTEIPSGEEMGFERGISYSKRLAPIYEDWAKFHNIEFLDAAKYAKASEIDACHLTRESHRNASLKTTRNPYISRISLHFFATISPNFLYNNNYKIGRAHV